MARMPWREFWQVSYLCRLLSTVSYPGLDPRARHFDGRRSYKDRYTMATDKVGALASQAVSHHGASTLPAVIVDLYNEELRDSEGFIGDRASGRASTFYPLGG